MEHRLRLCAEEDDFKESRRIEASLARDAQVRNWMFGGCFDPNPTRTPMYSTAWEELYLIDLWEPLPPIGWKSAGFVHIAKDATHRKYRVAYAVLEAHRNMRLMSSVLPEVIAMCRNAGCEKVEAYC